MAKYVIYAKAYDEKIGGNIALHFLCHLLNESGHQASIWDPHHWNAGRWHWRSFTSWPRFKATIQRSIWQLGVAQTVTNPEFNTPLTTRSDLRGAIVVYPEIVLGNPLESKAVVRWLLNKPGVRTDKVSYGKDELNFCFNPQFRNPQLPDSEQPQLKILYIRDDIYLDQGNVQRSGTCYILRKGAKRKIEHDLSHSVVVDDLSHAETAAVFNKVERCISYDTQTLLSRYALLCGCSSIVVPEQGVSLEEWRPNEGDRLGIAYGFADQELSHAQATRGDLIKLMNRQKTESLEQLKRFIHRSCDHFGIKVDIEER